MNKARYARLRAARDELELIRDEEQDAFDNLPENFQNSERGEDLQSGIDALEEACSALEFFA
jgi:hypothetical protein